MKYLTQVTETYRIDSEEEVKEAIDEAKAAKNYTLTKYTSQYKERKQKGEVVDAYYKVTLVKYFTSEKEPDLQVEVTYDEGSAF